MLRYRIFVFLLFVLCFFGYERVLAYDADNRPDWTKKNAQKIDYGDSYAFLGLSSAKKTKKEALDSAELDAFVHIGRLFGVTVGGSLEDIRVQSGENNKNKYSYRITDKNYIIGQAVTVEDSNIAETFTERENGKYNAWVLVKIPKSEYERIRKKVNGHTVWALKTNAEECNYDRMRDLIPVFKENGVNINNDHKEDFDKSIGEIVKKYPDSAYFMRIECVVKDRPQDSGEFFSRINFNVELLSLLNGQKLNYWKAREANTLKGVDVKGTGYSQEEARENGITKAIKKIIEQIKAKK